MTEITKSVWTQCGCTSDVIFNCNRIRFNDFPFEHLWPQPGSKFEFSSILEVIPESWKCLIMELVTHYLPIHLQIKISRFGPILKFGKWCFFVRFLVSVKSETRCEKIFSHLTDELEDEKLFLGLLWMSGIVTLNNISSKNFIRLLDILLLNCATF